jgi:hypothetical protein
MSINKWQVFCITENKWVYSWLDETQSKPTLCFNNNGHQINTESQQIVDSTQILTVKIEQESVPTGGNYSCQGFIMEIPPNSTNTEVVAWPFPITTSVVNIQETEANLGDTIDAIVNPRTLVGGTTSSTTVGSKTCTVNSTVIKHAQIGYDCHINAEHLGRITKIDPVNYTISFEKATTVEHQMGEHFFIELRIIRDYNLGSGARNALGSGNIGGKYLPFGSVTHVIYTNNSNITKKFMFNIEYLF